MSHEIKRMDIRSCRRPSVVCEGRERLWAALVVGMDIVPRSVLTDGIGSPLKSLTIGLVLSRLRLAREWS